MHTTWRLQRYSWSDGLGQTRRQQVCCYRRIVCHLRTRENGRSAFQTQLDIHDPITIIFGINVAEEVRNHMCFVFSPHRSSASALRNRKPRRQRTGQLCAQHSPTAAALSTFFLLNHAPNSPRVPMAKRIDYKT